MTNIKTAREPFFRIVKRDNIPAWQAWVMRISAIVAAIFVGA